MLCNYTTIFFICIGACENIFRDRFILLSVDKILGARGQCRHVNKP